MKLVMKKKKAIRKVIKKGYLSMVKIKESEYPIWHKHSQFLTVISHVINQCQRIRAYRRMDKNDMGTIIHGNNLKINHTR